MNAYDFFTFYLGPSDLQGKAISVTIAEVTVDEVFNTGTKKKEKKIVLHFVGKKKALTMNKTRTGEMMRITGTPEFSEWVGAVVVLTAGTQSGKDTIVISAPENGVQPEIKRSTHTTITELTGEKQPNPDPVKDSTWKAWTELYLRADAVQIEHANVKREDTTEADLRAGIEELTIYVTGAEEQATAA